MGLTKCIIYFVIGKQNITFVLYLYSAIHSPSHSVLHFKQS